MRADVTDDAKNACLYPECVHEAVARGLCGTHYQAARKLVLEGVTTWADLARRKKVGPGKRGLNEDHFMGPGKKARS